MDRGSKRTRQGSVSEGDLLTGVDFSSSERALHYGGGGVPVTDYPPPCFPTGEQSSTPVDKSRQVRGLEDFPNPTTV